ncbi:MAG: protein kinase [Alphaproteobacteria bacterium]|nr:protein kinase [Alphaproteobacteria bacterium]
MSVEKSISSSSAPSGLPPRHVVLSPGQQLNGYLVHAQISQAPHAFTYSGIESHNNHPVVIRLSRPDPDSQEAVRREAQTLGRIRHPGLVRMVGTSTVAGLPYIVLDREDGITLDRIIPVLGGAIAQSTVRDLMLRILDALEVVHAAGLVHCDLSPSNVLVRPDGSPVLLDFEAAQVPAEMDVVRSFVDVTPGYAAPELYSLDAQIGPWTDFYSVAAIAYSLLTGKAAPDATERTESRLLEGLDAEQCSPSFAAVIDSALALAPDSRPVAVKVWRDAISTVDAPSDNGKVTTLSNVVRRAQEETVELPASDDFPSTIRVEIADEPEAAEVRVPALTATPGDRSSRAPLPEITRHHRSGGGGRVFLTLVVVAAIAAGGWFGWEYYRWWSKTEWTVDAIGSADAATIAEAIENARPGSVIRVRSGIYRESLTIDKPISLIGESIEGQPVMIIPPAGRCLLVSAGSGIIDGLTFEGGDGTSPCIDLAFGDVEVANNVIANWKGTGMRLRDGGAAAIRGNQMRDVDGVGILIETGSGGAIEGNRIERSGKAGIKVRGGSAPTVSGNHIEGSGQGGLVIEGGSSGGYADNVIVAGKASGIEVRGGANPIVVENRVGSAGEAGIFVYEGARGRFAGNQIVSSRLSGVIIATGATPAFEGNEIRDNREHGIAVLGGAGGELSQNVIKQNRGHGVALGIGSTATLKDNVIEGNREPQVQEGEMETTESDAAR